jgi:hypothetical protein
MALVLRALGDSRDTPLLLKATSDAVRNRQK